MTTADIEPDSAASGSDVFAFDVGIIGLGYVGLPTGLAFHASGLRVLALDINAERLGAIQARDVDLLDVDQRRLGMALEDPDAFVLTDQAARLADARVLIICVPTPVDRYLAPDLTTLRAACATVVRCARPGQHSAPTSGRSPTTQLLKQKRRLVEGRH